MDSYPFVFTILFMLLGPLKTIGAFAAATRDMDVRFQRAVALRATVISAALMAFATLSGRSLLIKYQVSVPALQIAAGVVLLIAALRATFGTASAQKRIPADASPMQAAVAPISIPIVVAPAGVAAILAFAMVSPQHPGMMEAIAVFLAIILALDFVVMYFNRKIVKLGFAMLALQLMGAVLAFVQVALAIDTIISGLRDLGVLHAAGVPA